MRYKACSCVSRLIHGNIDIKDVSHFLFSNVIGVVISQNFVATDDAKLFKTAII